MADPYPTNVNIEIDRPRLQRYLRVKWLLSWLLGLFPFGLLMVIAVAGATVDNKHLPAGVLAAIIVKSIGIGMVSLFLGTLVLYFLCSHWAAAQVAANLEVTVEGPFLRIRQGALRRIDRKLHFRSILEYTTVQTFLLRKFDMHALEFTTPGVYRNPHAMAGNVIFGIKDCQKVRDMLADIDRLRENE